MGLQVILNTQTDFTGEFPVEYAKDGLWRFNDSAPDADMMAADSSGKGRKMFVSGWSGTTASFRAGGTISASTSQIPPRRKHI